MVLLWSLYLDRSRPTCCPPRFRRRRTFWAVRTIRMRLSCYVLGSC